MSGSRSSSSILASAQPEKASPSPADAPRHRGVLGTIPYKSSNLCELDHANTPQKPSSRDIGDPAAVRRTDLLKNDAPLSFLRTPPCQDGASAAKGTIPPARGSDRAARSEKSKGKGRQVLAMERRRSLAAQATRLQEQQRLEAEVPLPIYTRTSSAVYKPRSHRDPETSTRPPVKK